MNCLMLLPPPLPFWNGVECGREGAHTMVCADTSWSCSRIAVWIINCLEHQTLQLINQFGWLLLLLLRTVQE